jgi:hypothetical protein
MRFFTARVPAAAALLALLAATACCQGAAAAPLIWGGEAATAPSYDALQPPNYLPSPSSAPAAEAAEALTLTRAAVRRRLHISEGGQGGRRLEATYAPSASYGASFSPTASPPPSFKGEFSIGGLPSEAFENGMLSRNSTSALISALNFVVKQTCSSCSATILAVVDADGKSYFNGGSSRRRRLQTSSPNLKVTFKVDGSPENINSLAAALAAAPPTAFADSLAAKLQADKNWTVSVVLLSVPPASNAPPPVNVGAIAGGIVGGVVALGILGYCWSSRGGPSTKVASSEPPKPKV